MSDHEKAELVASNIRSLAYMFGHAGICDLDTDAAKRVSEFLAGLADSIVRSYPHPA